MTGVQTCALPILADLVGGLQAEQVEVPQQVVVEREELQVQLGQGQATWSTHTHTHTA